MLSAKFSHRLDKYLLFIAQKIPLKPNTITLIGFVITAIASAVLVYDLLLGGVLILVGGFFDMLDGATARLRKSATSFGAFLDSTLDRYSDGFMFTAISIYFYLEANLIGLALAIGALIGAMLVSYTRARAEGLGIKCHVGIMERPERVLLTAFGCLTGWLMPVIVAMFVLNNFTALQRIMHVYVNTKHDVIQ